MTTNQDSSVLVNLKDLFEMEADRRVDEATARERAKAEAAARAQRADEARAAEREAIRDEERRLAQVARGERDADLDGRIERLKAELEEVRVQREQMRDRIVGSGTAPAPSARGSWLAGTMAALSLAFAMTATFVAWPRGEAPLAVAAPTMAEVAPEPGVRSSPAPRPEVEAAPRVAPEPAAAPVAEPVAVARPTRPVRPPRVRVERADLASQLALDDDDQVLSDDFLNEASATECVGRRCR